MSRIGILLFDGVEELDFVGPYEVFTMTNEVFGRAGETRPHEITLLAEREVPIVCAKGMRVIPHGTIAQIESLDILLVPGGQGTRREVENTALLNWIARISADAQWVTSVCTGALLLAAAGPARGKRVTTHWAFVETLRARGEVGEMLEGVRYVRAVGECGLDFFEQPVPAHDLAGMARVAAASGIMIGADEGIHSRDDIERHHERNAARGVSLKAIKLGGVQAIFEAARLCDRLCMNLNISCKTGETSVASAVAMHVAAAVPSLAWGLTITSPGLAEDIVADPLRVEGGHLTVLDRPGLGVEVDERQVRRWQQELTARKVA